MKIQLNEIKRMQQLAGLLTENENKKTLWWIMIEKDGKRFYLKNAPYFPTEKEAHDYTKQHNIKNYSLKSREENVDDDGRIVEANVSIGKDKSQKYRFLGIFGPSKDVFQRVIKNVSSSEIENLIKYTESNGDEVERIGNNAWGITKKSNEDNQSVWKYLDGKLLFVNPHHPSIYDNYIRKELNKELAKEGLNEDYEVAMAQDSLDSIIRAAMMLKSQMGDQEVDLPAWIQDHISNSENYIDQASQGYHEINTKITNNMNENNLGHNETASISQEGAYWIVTYKTMDGTKEKVFKYENEARKFFNTLDESQPELEEGLGDAQYYKAISAADSKTSPMDSISSVKRFLKTKFKNLDDSNIDYLAKEWAKKTGLGESQQEMDEALVRRWQYYARIK